MAIWTSLATSTPVERPIDRDGCSESAAITAATAPVRSAPLGARRRRRTSEELEPHGVTRSVAIAAAAALASPALPGARGARAGRRPRVAGAQAAAEGGGDLNAELQAAAAALTAPRCAELCRDLTLRSHAP